MLVKAILETRLLIIVFPESSHVALGLITGK